MYYSKACGWIEEVQVYLYGPIPCPLVYLVIFFFGVSNQPSNHLGAMTLVEERWANRPGSPTFPYPSHTIDRNLHTRNF